MRRPGELAASLAALERRLVVACAAANRDRAELTLVAVSKTFPAADVAELAGLGLRDFGESRDQEAAPKAAELAGLALRWHFVGRLQTNKCPSVASYADVVHSVDRPRLARALGRGARRAERRVEVLVQVSLDGDPGRGGVEPSQLPALAALVAGEGGLRLRGLMAVAPPAQQPEAAFARLAGLAGRLRAEHPQAGWISAGMSVDLEAAIAHGATHVRVGTALLGGRPRVVR